MPGKSVLDNYTQFAIVRCNVGWAAGTPSELIGQLVTGLSNLQKIAWAVSRIEYEVDMSALSWLGEALDEIRLALTASSSTTQIMTFDNASIYDLAGIGTMITQAAADPFSGRLDFPIVHQFNEPLLILPQNIYLATRTYNTTGSGSVSNAAKARIHYKEVELGPEDWYDLLQLRMPLGAT